MSDLLTLTADVDLQAAAKDKPATVTILAYSGGEIRPGGFGPTVIDIAGLTLGRVSLLVDHDSSLGGVVGHGEASASQSAVTVTGKLTRASEAATKLIAMAADGVEWQASVGMDITQSEFVRPGREVAVNGRKFTAGPRGLTVARKGELKEVSVLSLGADHNTAVTIAAKRGKTMTTNTNTATTDVHERDRLEAIHEVKDKFSGMFPGRERERDEMIAAAIDDNKMTATQLEIDLYKAAMTVTASAIPRDDYDLQFIRDSRPKLGARFGGGRPTGEREVLEASLLVRAGFESAAVNHYGEQAAEIARRTGPTNLVDLCGAILRSENRDVPSSYDGMIRAAFSTESLPTVLENTVGRSMIQPFMDTTSNWRSFVTVKSAESFREQKSARPSSFHVLDRVGKGGEIPHSTLAEDGAYTWSVGTFGRMIGITRETIINDDLGFISEYGPLLAQAAGRSLNDLVWSTILGGQTAGFFSSGNGNLLEAGSDLDIESLTLAIATMKKMVDVRGYNIDNTPIALVVPPDIEMTARALLNSTDIVAVSNTTMPAGNALRGAVPNLVSEARLSNTDRFGGASAASWYLFASPLSNAVIVGFLRGQQTPTVETADSDFNTLGLQMRVFFDYGCALGDSRGGLKATGAGGG